MRRWMVGALVTAIAAIYVGDVVVAIDRGGPPSAGELLGRARRFADDARTMRFTAAIDTDGSKSSATGVVVFPDRYRARFVDGGHVREELYADGTLFGRTPGARWRIVDDSGARSSNGIV